MDNMSTGDIMYLMDIIMDDLDKPQSPTRATKLAESLKVLNDILTSRGIDYDHIRGDK